MAKYQSNLYLAAPFLPILFLGSLISPRFAATTFYDFKFDRASVSFNSSIETLLKEGNFTSEAWIENITVALITAAATILGTFIGYVLTLRATKHSEKIKFRITVLKGIRGLISELDENERLIQIGKEVNHNIWDTVRYQYWFIPPVIERKIEDNLRQLYYLLEGYNKELSVIRISNPAILREQIQEYVRKNNIQTMIQTARTDLEKIATKIVEEILAY
jgi:predicted Zn-dependent protease with MMP-like domain